MPSLFDKFNSNNISPSTTGALPGWGWRLLRKGLLIVMMVTAGCAGIQPQPIQGYQPDPTANQGSTMTIRLPNGLYIRKTVVSLREARYDRVVPQRYDLSCGAAALATILNYYFGHPVNESDIIHHILEHGNVEEIRQKGFSLLDLKSYAIAHGYMADGYKVELNQLQKVKIPVIILFRSGNYSHFVVLKGIHNGNAYIADPAFGNRSMPLDSFEENWNQVIFVVANENMKNLVPLPMETTLPAPVLAAMRHKDLYSSGFSGFTSGEF